MADQSMTKLEPGMLHLYDHQIPALQAGDYEITVEHTTDLGNFSKTQSFTVQGPQFALEQGDVYAMYPPGNSRGQYMHTLPHLLLSKRVLPWERGLTREADNIPWMALLVFEEGELLGGEGADTKTTTLSVQDFFSQDSDVLKPQITPESDVDLNIPIQSITITSEVFQQIVPRLSELEFLAHCRLVNTDDKEVLSLKDDGSFSVVVSNRFPGVNAQDGTDGTKNIVHLVSLEGWQGYLQDDSAELIGKQMRLVSLASWSFFCQEDPGESFKGLMQNLAAAGQGDLNNLLLRIPMPDAGGAQRTPAQTLIQNRLRDGYVPLEYHTQSGEETFAWYRGPFVPRSIATWSRTEPLATASAAMLFDQDNGVFDQTYAAAWQAGRSLALADQHFAINLFRLRQKSHRMTDQMVSAQQSKYAPVLLQQARGNANGFKSLLGSKQLIQYEFSQVLDSDFADRLHQTMSGTTKLTPEQIAVAAVPQTRSVSSRATGQDSLALAKQVAADPMMREIMQDALEDDFAPLVQWLAKLKLLYNFPLNYLVPDWKMLPQESLRFFYVDPNWLDSMIDGALSIGVQSSRDSEFNRTIKDQIQSAAYAASTQVRAQLRGQASLENVKATIAAGALPGVRTGLLIRSSVISGWPGLTIKATDQGQEVKLLRMERILPDLMLCLFEGVPDHIEIDEPQETMHFGVDDTGDIELRSAVHDDTIEVGEQTGSAFAVWPRYLRSTNADSRVLNLNDLQSALKTTLGGYSHTWGASEFAIQMLRVAERFVFELKS